MLNKSIRKKQFTLFVVVLGHMEGIKDMVVVVEEDVSRTSTILQDGDHFTFQASILVPNQSTQTPGGQSVVKVCRMTIHY